MAGSSIRVLTVVPLCDGHDSAITAINQELVRSGIEVVYLGFHRSVADIVRAAVHEDVAAVGISSYNGGHIEFFREVAEGLRAAGRPEIGLFGGGGGTITPEDARRMTEEGTDRIFGAGATFQEMVDFVRERYVRVLVPPDDGFSAGDSLALARVITCLEEGVAVGRAAPTRGDANVVGITGPGGAGKTTLIDELSRQYLSRFPEGRIAVLTHDPGAAGRGALLGDRATMVYAQDDRIFMRSLSTRGRQGGLAPCSAEALAWLASEEAGFDLVLVETVGTGQEALPFPEGMADVRVLVMNTDYGARLQLQKILMLEAADVVVANKHDRPGSRTAVTEMWEYLERHAAGKPLIPTVASHHGDAGVETLLNLISNLRHEQAG